MPLPDTPNALAAKLVTVPAVADDLGRRFAAAGHELHLVGGSVRDALLARLPAAGRPGFPATTRRSGPDPAGDFDFATDARPERVLELVGGWAEATWTTGIRFGTVGVQKAGRRLEITTYRADRYDRLTRHPEVEYGESLEADLGRRDFAVNAMALSVPGHEFRDPYGGLRDLAEGRLRTPAAAEESFADDPLRMLRACRFVAQLGLTPDAAMVAAMTAMAAEITRIAVERVQVELSKVLLGGYPRQALELFVGTGLASQLLPELPALRMEIDEHHQHKDVYAHTLTVLEQAIAAEPDGEPDLVLRMAALLHDIGKPATRRNEPGGRVSFHHHEVVGAKLVRRRLRALGFPKDFVSDVAQLVFLHLRFHGYGRGEWTDSAVRRYVTDAGSLLGRLHLLVRSDCTTRDKRRAATLARSYDRLEERIDQLAEKEELDRIRPDLDGNEIMALTGLPPGPLVGQAYRHLLAIRMERGPLPRDEVVAELRSWARDRGITVSGPVEEDGPST